MLRTNTQVCLRGIKAYLKELTSSTLFFSRAPNANARAARLACQAPAIECRFSQIAHSRTTNTWSSSLMFPCYSLCQQETSTKRQKLQIQQLVVKLEMAAHCGHMMTAIYRMEGNRQYEILYRTEWGETAFSHPWNHITKMIFCLTHTKLMFRLRRNTSGISTNFKHRINYVGLHTK